MGPWGISSWQVYCRKYMCTMSHVHASHTHTLIYTSSHIYIYMYIMSYSLKMSYPHSRMYRREMLVKLNLTWVEARRECRWSGFMTWLSMHWQEKGTRLLWLVWPAVLQSISWGLKGVDHMKTEGRKLKGTW